MVVSVVRGADSLRMNSVGRRRAAQDSKRSEPKDQFGSDEEDSNHRPSRAARFPDNRKKYSKPQASNNDNYGTTRRTGMKRKAPEESDSSDDSEGDEFDADNDEEDVSGELEQASTSRHRSRPSRSSTTRNPNAVTPPRKNHTSRTKRRKLNDDNDHANDDDDGDHDDAEDDDDDDDDRRPQKKGRSPRQSRPKMENASRKSDDETKDKSNAESVEESSAKPRRARTPASPLVDDGEVKMIGADLRPTDIIDANGKRYPFRQRNLAPGALTDKFPPIFRRRSRSENEGFGDSDEEDDDFSGEDDDDDGGNPSGDGDDDDDGNQSSSAEQIESGDERVQEEMKTRREKRIRHMVKRYQPQVNIRSRAGEDRDRDRDRNRSRKNDRNRRRSRRYDSSDSSDDERRNKALMHEIPRPINAGTIGASNGGGLGVFGAHAGAKADISPLPVDTSITFDSIGGLDHHIQSLKEMVVFPLLYPDVFKSLDVTPPKGVLFYGPPGTGKTLVARALANSCSGTTPVAFFMRKGADILSKWVGEAERQLRLLFDEARRLQPSIIFFDEIDGLAPVRSSKNDQIHSSIVSTLLALMDGLDNRGQVIVIGATNRIDAIDPALRRPGRFDREFLFSLPSHEARARIIDIHTSKWDPPMEDSVKSFVADRTAGFCGADLKQLCTEAALNALRRQVPQIYLSNDRLLFDPKSIRVQLPDFEAALRRITPASGRGPASSTAARALPLELKPLLDKQLSSLVSALCTHIFPLVPEKINANSIDQFGNPLSKEDRLLRTLHADSQLKQLSHRPRLLITAEMPGSGQSEILAALLERLEEFPQVSIDLMLLHGDSVTRTLEESLVSRFNEACRKLPAIIVLPHIDDWWDNAPPSLRATLLHLTSALPATSPLLFIATSDTPATRLEKDILSMFSTGSPSKTSVVSIPAPDQKQRGSFFYPVIQRILVPPMALGSSAMVPKAAELPVLEKAPPVAIVREPSPEEKKRVKEFDDHVKRQMRGEFRDILERLRSSRSKFAIFWKNLSDANYPEYSKICPNALSLQDLLQRIDAGCYITPEQFLEDFNTIVSNACTYFAEDDPNGVITRAKAMQDMVEDMVYDIGDELIALAVETAKRCEPEPKPVPIDRAGNDDEVIQKESEDFRRLSKRVANQGPPQAGTDAPANEESTFPREVDSTPSQKTKNLRKRTSGVSNADDMEVDAPQPEVPSTPAASSSAVASSSSSTKSKVSTSPASTLTRVAAAVRESQRWDVDLNQLKVFQQKVVARTENFSVDQLMFVYVKLHNMIVEESGSVSKTRLMEKLNGWIDDLRL